MTAVLLLTSPEELAAQDKSGTRAVNLWGSSGLYLLGVCGIPSTASLLLSRALHHHPLPFPWASGLVLWDHHLPGTWLRGTTPQHPLVEGRWAPSRLQCPGPPHPTVWPLEAVRDLPHSPSSLPNPAQNGVDIPSHVIPTHAIPCNPILCHPNKCIATRSHSVS